MPDATTEFFEQLGKRGHEPALARATGTMRFDLTDGKRTVRWRVVINKGDVKVSRANGSADTIARTNKDLFDGIVTGKANPVTAMLRGEFGVEGNLELVVLFQRLFPGPPKARKRS